MSIGAGASAIAGNLVSGSQSPLALLMVGTIVLGIITYARLLVANRQAAATAAAATTPVG